MAWILPLAVAAPLLAAALLVGSDHVAPEHFKDAIALLGSGTATVCCVLVLLHSERRDVLHWFGGWRPTGGVALGVSFVADPFGAGMALLASGLTLAALAYSWTYMRDAARPYDALLLAMQGAMAGFALTGDLFNMFVWFELIGVAAYALAGHQVKELGPLQGAVNFAISNSVGGYLILVGIALLYGRTGALNLAQIGHELAAHSADRLVVVAFTLLVTGLLAKAAIVPFHLWHADAHAVAPAPVCAVFSGAMIELGLLFVARVYWATFEPVFPGPPIRSVLVVLGVVTMLVAAVMCFLQRHLKRMLVFSTIAEAGAILTGVGLLDPTSLAGAANVVLSHGLLKAGLFLVSGLIVLRLKDADELRLRGRGRALPVIGMLWCAAAVGLVGVPYLGVFLGHALLDDGAGSAGIHWLQPITMVSQGICAGTLLRAGARVFLGWGAAEDELLTPEPEERVPERSAFAPAMLAITGVVVALGLAASVVPGLERRSEAAARRFVDHAAYAARVLRDAQQKPTPRLPYDVPRASPASIAYGAGATVLTIAVAAFGLWHRRLPDGVRRAARRSIGPPVDLLRSVHSGIVGDYLLWIVAGTAVIGAVWAFTLT
jgi:multicomponent Na+:H+ antiporter subunit D